MNTGIGIFLRNFAPLTLYLSGWACAIIAMSGKVRWALMLLTFLIPLRNINEKVLMFPLGNQFIDILIIGIIIGGAMNKKSTNSTIQERSSINTIAIINIVFLLFSLFRGDFFLYGSFNFDVHDSRVQDWKNFSLMPLLFLLNFKNTTSKKEIWTMFIVMCFSMFVVDYYTINQIREHPSALISRDQIKGTFQFLGPNEVAAFFNQYSLILISVLYAVKKGKYKWSLLILVFANIFCVMFLFSRGAYIGLTVGLLILFACKDKKLLIPLFLVLLLWQSVLPKDVVDRIKETKTATGQLEGSAQGRINIWEKAIGYIKLNPIVGIGFGSFRHLGLELLDTHNIYVKIMTEQGLVGIIIFLITVFYFIKEGWQLYQKGDDELSKALGLGFVCCIFVMMVNNCFGDRWSYLEPNAFLWIFASLVAKLNVISQNSQAEKQTVPKKANLESRFRVNDNKNDSPKLKNKIRYYDPPEK